MDRPEQLPDDVAKELEKLDSQELSAAIRYAEHLAKQRAESLAELRERQKRSLDSNRVLFNGSDGSTYYETGSIWGTVKIDDDS
jgi:hypothetical protein